MSKMCWTPTCGNPIATRQPLKPRAGQTIQPKAPPVYRPVPLTIAAPPVYRPPQIANPAAQLKQANDLRLEKRPAPPGCARTVQLRPLPWRPGTTIQPIIEGYEPGKLRGNTLPMRKLTPEQRQYVQDLHDEPNTTYTVEQARKLAKLAHSGDSSTGSGSREHTPPFPFRYGSSQSSPMKVEEQHGGVIIGSNPFLPKEEDDIRTISIAKHTGFDSLTKGSKRNITQSDVMGRVSPNKAAAALGLDCPTSRSWEWLHLVAFSITPTHVDKISSNSLKLIKRTGQPQQITENLVLGTAAANTAMLTYETIIKENMKKRPSLSLDLWTCPRIEKRRCKIDGKSTTVPVATSISYHFFFKDEENSTAYAPIIIEFDTLHHQKPTKSEYSTNVDLFEEFMGKPVILKHVPRGIRTDELEELPRRVGPIRRRDRRKKKRRFAPYPY